MSEKSAEVGEKIEKVNEVKVEKVSGVKDPSTEKDYGDAEKENEVLTDHSEVDY